MGCCNGSVIVLVICTLQLITTIERLVLDFMGFLYFSIIPNFVQIIIVIIAIFGLCLYKHRLLIVYLVWAVIFIGWNIFVICIYQEVGAFNTESMRLLSFGTSNSRWMAITETCSSAGTCVLRGQDIETIHAGVQILLSLIGCISGSYVTYLLREKDDTSPIFQVYKAPSSRRSSVSLRPERDGGTLETAWISPSNGRDSLRSNRSVRSNRSTRSASHNRSSTNSNRQSKKSNRGSTRSKGKPANGSVRGNIPNSLPWQPAIAASSAADSDVPATPQTPSSPVPPGMAVAAGPSQRGHENESYNYASSSENPYVESSRHQRNVNHGFSPGSPPDARRRSGYKPQNLANSFNAVADLPPPLDEGPEAYSRDSQAFPPPPPPIAAEPDGTSHQQDRSNTNNARQPISFVPRPVQLPIRHPATPQKQLASPSSCTSSAPTEKSDRASDITSPSTPDKPLPSPAGYRGSAPQQQHFVRGYAPPTHHPQQQTATALPLTTQNLRALDQSSSATRYNNLSVVPPPAAAASPAVSRDEPSVHSVTSRHDYHQLEPRNPAKQNQSYTSVNIPAHPRQPEHVANNATSVRTRSSLASDLDEIPLQMIGASRPSPTKSQEPHAMSRPVIGAPKDNTFRRMVTGNLSVAKPTSSEVSPTAAPHGDSTYAKLNKPTGAPLAGDYNSQRLPATSYNSRPSAVTSSSQPVDTFSHSSSVYPAASQLPRVHAQDQSSNMPYNPPIQADRMPVDSKRNLPFNAYHTQQPVNSRDPPRQTSEPQTNGVTKGSIPPWERNSQRKMNNPIAPASTHGNAPRGSTLQNNMVTSARNEPDKSHLYGPVKEVTSSYGGLYSSQKSPVSRRRGNPRGPPIAGSRENLLGSSHMGRQYDYGSGGGNNQFANATDDIKTKSGPVVSSNPLVV